MALSPCVTANCQQSRTWTHQDLRVVTRCIVDHTHLCRGNDFSACQVSGRVAPESLTRGERAEAGDQQECHDEQEPWQGHACHLRASGPPQRPRLPFNVRAADRGRGRSRGPVRRPLAVRQSHRQDNEGFRSIMAQPWGEGRNGGPGNSLSPDDRGGLAVIGVQMEGKYTMSDCAPTSCSLQRIKPSIPSDTSQPR